MILLLIVCIMKIVNMTSYKTPRKYGGAKENQPINFLYENKGSKLYCGMTEHPYQKSWLPHFYPQQKRPLRNTNNIVFNDVNNGYGNYHLSNNVNHCDDKIYDKFGELTEENLKNNVEIVLNNINRNYNALKNFILNEKVNNNLLKGGLNMISSPESDCNSNVGGPLGCSIASSQDFTHDNSDYQWFLDYGYRDGVTHQSVLSSLSASYNGIGELSYYEDLAKNIDANLAEVDMESFRAEDIHSLLTTLPSLCSENNHNRKQNDLDNSICKSELLFSPVKESHISVDSLDMGEYPDDGDIILTCQANKNNYTIAFEGSTVYSDDSYYDNDINGKLKQTSMNIMCIDDIVKKKALEVSMTRSETGLTTWSKLKKSSTSQLQRYPSGNNNTSINIVTHHAPTCFARRSSSMPNLRYKHQNQLNVSQAISNSSVESYRKKKPSLPLYPMPISSTESDGHEYGLQHSNTSNAEQMQNPPSFNLVKLFIKQKSHSSDTCMDVSSGCWPSDASSSHEQKQRKKSMNDSGKGSALSRHDEDCETSFQYDSLDVAPNQHENSNNNIKPKTNDLYREVFDSPAHRNYRECNLNIRNIPKYFNNLNNNNNNNNSIERDSLKDNNKSISDASRTSDNLTQVFNKTQISLDLITRSIQTSFIGVDKLRMVPPSFLAQLNKLGDKQKAPVYVVYPNYTLPNLDFVDNTQSEIILSPLGYKESFSARKQRPYSCNDTDNFKHERVVDWRSLGLLLPPEYRKVLKETIPDVCVEDLSAQRPLFCMTPPIKKSRPFIACDCASYGNNTNISSESSQPPSSGYRGSSTMLDESELNNEMFVYNYDTNEITTERPPSGRTPRGILRRNNSNTKVVTKGKRNSMFEELQQQHNYEKRRSVQDPYYMPEGHNIIEDYIAEMNDIEIAHRYRNRLPNRPHSTYNNSNNNISPHELSELELNKALNNRINQMNTTFNKNENDNEARVRAENFLCNIPKSELKYYAEVANLLETMENNPEAYDRVKLKNDVSRALSKKVSFNNSNRHNFENQNFLTTGKVFTTPPNSPNISVATSRMEPCNDKLSEREKQEKINNNRFKRLQIQWELLSKDSIQLQKELEIKSAGSTPTNGGPPKSRIPRPVSYPTTKPAEPTKAIRSPSRLLAPKKYSTPSLNTTPTNTNNSTPKTPNKVHTTPKKTIPTSRPTTRTR